MQYATKIPEYFHNRKAFFIIPLYQRAYAWNNDNCKRLFDDILIKKSLLWINRICQR